MSENQNTEIDQSAEELDDEQLNDVVGGGGSQQGVVSPQANENNIIVVCIAVNQPQAPQLP
jgi:hypothetical protein